MRTENPRTAILFVLFVVGTACLLGLTGFAFSGSPNTPSDACIRNLNGPSQSQYHDLLQALAKNLEFIAMTQGRCFGFISGYEVTGPQGRNTYLVFDHYTPHVVYYCNYLAAHQVDERL